MVVEEAVRVHRHQALARETITRAGTIRWQCAKPDFSVCLQPFAQPRGLHWSTPPPPLCVLGFRGVVSIAGNSSVVRSRVAPRKSSTLQGRGGRRVVVVERVGKVQAQQALARESITRAGIINDLFPSLPVPVAFGIHPPATTTGSTTTLRARVPRRGVGEMKPFVSTQNFFIIQ
jgi:hypothetical protein